MMRAHESRKLVVSMNVTLDGFLSGIRCELDWHFQLWTISMAETITEELEKADTILFGRKTYQAMSEYWSARAEDAYCPKEDMAFIQMMNGYRKVVFSRTLARADWNNSILIKTDLKKAVLRLKKGKGKNLVVYGSGKMVAALLEAKVVDEFQLWVHPVAIGKGKPLFPENDKITTLTLTGTKSFASGVVLFYYSCEKEKSYPSIPSKEKAEKLPDEIPYPI